MPIYEFYCEPCNTIFNFLSRSIDTSRVPSCPKCEASLKRQVSLFAVTGKAKGGEDEGDLPFDEAKMEKAMEALAGEAEKMREDDPRQAANLMRKLSDMTGIQFGATMDEALRRMEKGADPEEVEAELGDLMEGEEPFLLPEKKGKAGPSRRAAPARDDTLYEM
jgi:putative FmdB family regulatory protein